MASNELFLYGAIGAGFGEGVTPERVRDDLAKLRGRITVRINSPGGDVFDASAIHALLAEWPGGLDVQIDGVAASAASYIAMVGGSVRMSDGALMMIHNAWTGTLGNADDHDAASELLRKVDGNLVNAYVRKSGKSAATIRAAMKAETWYTADEAVSFGLADGKTRTRAAAYKVPSSFGYKNAPRSVLTTDGQPGLSVTALQLQIDLARAKARHGTESRAQRVWTPAEVRKRIAEARAQIAK